LAELLIFPKELSIFLCNSQRTSVSFFAGLQDLLFQALVIWHPFMTQTGTLTQIKTLLITVKAIVRACVRAWVRA